MEYPRNNYKSQYKLRIKYIPSQKLPIIGLLQ
ncbi:hypothetical protein AQEC111735_06915 [Aquirufa ecclesiirivi]